MRRLLILKHWQFFLLLFGICGIPQFLMFDTIMNSANPSGYFSIIYICFLIIYGGWLYAFAENVSKLVSTGITISLKKFRISFFYVICYSVFFSFYQFQIIKSFNKSFFKLNTILILALHILAMLSLFYCIWFNAKILNTVELKKKATVKDFINDIFLICFFPLGIWIIQPRLNKLFR